MSPPHTVQSPADPLLERALDAFSAHDLDTAEQMARRALLADPRHAGSCAVLGSIYVERNELAFGLAFLERATRLSPSVAVFHFNLGAAYEALLDHPRAMSAYQRVLRLQPEHADALLRYAGLLYLQGQPAQALPLLQVLQRVDPQAPELALQWAAVHACLGADDIAERAFQQACSHGDDAAPATSKAAAQWEFAHFLLARKRFAEGWDSYEYRHQLDDDLFPHPQPLWSGESLVGKTLLVHTEQGLGDEIMFGSVLEEATREAARVIVIADPALIRLWRQSLNGRDADPHLQGHPEEKFQVFACWRADDSPPDWYASGQIDYQLPFGRLPALFRRRIEDFRYAKPYLRPSPHAVRQWQHRLNALMQDERQDDRQDEGRFRIGLMWAANPCSHDLAKSLRSQRKSMALNDLAPLSSAAWRDRVQFISLANHVHGSQVGTVPALDLIDLSEHLDDLADTAALMQHLDLVITVDTSIAHLAGAMGLPTWVLLCHDADWRWGQTDERSYWYPSVELIRQTTAGDWQPVVQGVMARLATRLSQ